MAVKLWIVLTLLASCVLPVATAAELPGERLGRPLRVHVARGLWWQMLRLHEAIGQLGGAEVTSSVDVFGSPTGYHGSATALGTFPHGPEALEKVDLIVLAGCRVEALSTASQQALVAWVRAGGGLFITGGPMSLDCDTYGPLEEILPVVLTPQRELAPTGGAALSAAAGSGLESLDWAAQPRLFWVHSGVTAKATSQTVLLAGDAPALVTGEVGKGRVAIFSGTVCGNPGTDETAFWEWDDWPVALSMVLARLAPRAAVPPLRPPLPEADTRKAKARLAEIGEDILDGFFDDGDLADASTGDTGKELVELARLTRSSAYAVAVLQAVSASNTRLTPAQAGQIFQALVGHAPAASAAKSSEGLLNASDAGRAILGLRLAGLARRQAAGPTMVRIVAEGLDALPRESSGGGAVGLRAPDGSDELLRLAAGHALADLADPGLTASLRQALVRWQGTRNQVAMLANRQESAEEAIMGALAIMGDADAAAWMVDRVIANALAREAAIDISETRSRNPSPEVVRLRQQGAERAALLAERQALLTRTLGRLPTSSWPGLAAKIHVWEGEHATEALLLALATQGAAEIAPEAREAIKRMQDESPVPAIRMLCRIRLHGD